MNGINLMYGLNYVDESFIYEANPWRTTEKYISRFAIVLIPVASVVIICAILFAAIFGGGLNNNSIQPLGTDPITDNVETQSEETNESEEYMEESSTNEPEDSEVNIELSRDFTKIMYGYAGEESEILDPASRELLCSTIESVLLREASGEEWNEYQQLVGQYPFDLGDISFSMTLDYIQIEGIGLFRFKDEKGMVTIRSVIEEIVNR